MPARGAERRFKRAITPSSVAADVLGARVDVDGEDGGRVTGVLAHPADRAIGLQVTSPGSEPRFLPLVAATMSDGVVGIPSALLLVESCDAYLARGATMCRDAACVEELGATAGERVSNALVAGSSKR